jgi:hypothetical protein
METIAVLVVPKSPLPVRSGRERAFIDAVQHFTEPNCANQLWLKASFKENILAIPKVFERSTCETVTLTRVA